MNIKIMIDSDSNGILLGDSDITPEKGNGCGLMVYLSQDRKAQVFCRKDDYRIYAIKVTGLSEGVLEEVAGWTDQEQAMPTWISWQKEKWCVGAQKEIVRLLENGEV